MQLSGLQLGLRLLVVSAICLPSAAWAAMQPDAAVTGVVRDVQGIAQGGALVQVMAAGLESPRSAFTDSHGRYSIANLVPGRYAVQASAALFISSTKGNLLLVPGKWATVNLTLATLFDTTAWLPAERRTTDEPGDDWKWTLRSSANRPMLRMVDDSVVNGVEDGGTILVSSSATERKRDLTQGEAAFQSGAGGFGHGGTHNLLAASRETGDGSEFMLRVDAGMPTVPIGVGPSTEIDAGFGRQLGFAGAARTVISYQNHPEIVSSSGVSSSGVSSSGGVGQDANVGLGLAAMQMSSAQQINLGDSIKIEAGSTVYAVRTIETVVGARPFVRLAIEPAGEWTIGYRMATSRTLQGFADLDAVEQELPVAVTAGKSLEVEHGRHQEISVSRKAWHGVAQATVYQDNMNHPAISGGGLAAIGTTAGASGVLEDPSTESFRFLGRAYTSDGVNLLVSEPLSMGMWAALEYSTGSALSGRGVTDGMALTDAAASLQRVRAQTATLAIKGRLICSGTRVRAAYRWQPVSLVTAIDAYRAFNDQAFMSLSARQPIRLGRLLPPGLEGTVSVTNLLAQGYRPFLSADGSTLFLAQSPRTLEAGLSVSF